MPAVNAGTAPMVLPMTCKRKSYFPSSFYSICLAIQSAAALTILIAVLRAFRTVIDSLGLIHAASGTEIAVLAISICVFQAAYWHRLNGIEMPGWRNVLIGHVVGFTSRLTFIFGGALFSLFFLRHAPELSSSEGAAILIPRIALLLASLFCLYCYTLELERLANALQSKSGRAPRR